MLKSRLLRIVLALSLVICFTPAPAFAAEDEPANTGTSNAQTAGDSENSGGSSAGAGDDVSGPTEGTTISDENGGNQTPVEDVADDQAVNDTTADNAVKRNGEADVEEGLSKGAGESATVVYETHVQYVGWQDKVNDGQTAGTIGHGLAIEALRISLENVEGGITYRAYVPGEGWQDWAADGETAGTTDRKSVV